MTVSAASLNNPDPQNWTNITYQVKSGDCLWTLAQNVVLEEHKGLSGADLEAATAKELALIEKANPQIGNDDLIYPGDKIAVPVETPEASVPKADGTGKAGFSAPSQPKGTELGIWDGGTKLKPGQDILSADGKYDLVMLSNGDLVLYQLKTAHHRSDNYADDKVVWQSGTVGQPVAYAAQVTDGHGNTSIVLYASDGSVIKSIPVSSIPSNLLQVSVGPLIGGLRVG
jgi:hypothetical protein